MNYISFEDAYYRSEGILSPFSNDWYIYPVIPVTIKHFS